MAVVIHTRTGHRRRNKQAVDEAERTETKRKQQDTASQYIIRKQCKPCSSGKTNPRHRHRHRHRHRNQSREIPRRCSTPARHYHKGTDSRKPRTMGNGRLRVTEGRSRRRLDEGPCSCTLAPSSGLLSMLSPSKN